MPRRSRARRSSSIGLILVLIVIIYAVYYIQTGSDPLGVVKPISQAATALATSIGIPPRGTAAAVPTPASGKDTPAAAQPFAVSGDWWDVYFVVPLRLNESEELAFRNKIPAQSYPGSIAEKLVQRIDNAQRTIHIASFETDLNDVANALVRAKQRGVDVRWITDDESGIQADTKAGHGQFKTLKAAGIPVIDDSRGALMHHKFWVFDGQTVWTGSTNVTVSGVFEQDNNTIVIESPELAAIYERQFEEMWGGAFNAKSPSAVNQQSINLDGTSFQILFSPEDKAISHIVPYVQSAQTSIEFMAFTYTHDQLGTAMIERKKNGVDVRGVFEATGSDTDFSEMSPLYCAKASVRQDGNPAFLHHKVIIIDDHIVITGSLNFTENGDEQNNENVIIVDNAEIATLYTQEFQRIWEAGHEPDSGKMNCK
jgi:phosphatidylserine/phosphatidylglycerophosphate/cardiolipin synthase-like enzyme